MIIIKISIGWAWFCYGIFFTIKNYPEKRKFYIALAIFYSIWFVNYSLLFGHLF
jgi:hypothetical protein